MLWFPLLVFSMLLWAAITYAVTDEPLYLFDWLMIMLLLFVLVMVWW